MRHALKRFPGINRKSRVSYPGPRFLSSATSPSLPKKHFNGLINQLALLETCIINFTQHHLVKLYNGLLDTFQEIPTVVHLSMYDVTQKMAAHFGHIHLENEHTVGKMK